MLLTPDGEVYLPDTTKTVELFRHVSAEKAPLYRAVLETFAAAKRQFRLHLRPDELDDQ